MNLTNPRVVILIGGAIGLTVWSVMRMPRPEDHSQEQLDGLKKVAGQIEANQKAQAALEQIQEIQRQAEAATRPVDPGAAASPQPETAPVAATPGPGPGPKDGQDIPAN